MKIAHNVPEMLVVEARPLFLAAIFLLFSAVASYGAADQATEPPIRAMLAGIAVGILFLVRHFIHWVTATFDRSTGRIEIVRRGILFDRRETYPLRRLKMARIDADGDSVGVTTRLTLLFDDAMLEEIEHVHRDRLVRGSAGGWRTVRPNEVPLTAYFSAGDQADRVAHAINDWIASSGEKMRD